MQTIWKVGRGREIYLQEVFAIIPNVYMTITLLLKWHTHQWVLHRAHITNLMALCRQLYFTTKFCKLIT